MFFQGQPSTESFQLLAFISLINCNLIITDYKGLFFLLHYHRAAVKVQNPQNHVYLVLMTNTTQGFILLASAKPDRLGSWMKRLKQLFPSNIYSYFLLSQTRCQAPAASWLLRVFGSLLNSSGALCEQKRPVQIAPAVTFTPGRDWEKSCCFCFTRVLWALACTYTQ